MEYWETDDASQGGLVANLSQTGLLIYSIVETDIGVELKIKVSFTMGDTFDCFEALAQIVWKSVHFEAGWTGYKYGLEFTQISQDNRQKLRRLLAWEQAAKLHHRWHEMTNP
jgi:hypothetical protein